MPPKWRDDTQVDFRIGAEAQFVVALARRLRAIVGFDAEVSPKQLAFRTDFNHFVPGQTHMPLYTLGLGLGLEVAVP